MTDAELPTLDDDPQPRFDHYANLLASHWEATGQWAPNAWPTTLAVAAAESGLNQFAIGPNQRNGTPPESDAYYSVGYGWLQTDSWWIWRNVQIGAWPIEQCRPEPFLERPTLTLHYLLQAPGYANGNRYHTEVEWERWTVYRLGRHEPWLPHAIDAILRL